MFSSLKNKLMATYLIIIVLALSMVGGYLLLILERTAENSLAERLRAQTLLLAEMMEGLFGDGAGVEPEYMVHLAEKTGARVTLINSLGAVLGDSQGLPDEMDNHRERPEMAAALQGREGLSSRYSTTTGEEMLYLAVPVRGEGGILGAVRLSLPLTEIRRQGRQQWSLLVAAILVATVVTAFISLRFAQALIRPLEPIKEMAAQVAAGREREPLQGLGNDEIGQLGRAINEMAGALRDKIREVEEGRNRLETVLENIPVAVLFVEKYKNVLLVNEAAEKLLGLERRLLVGQRLEKTLRDPRVLKEVDEALAGRSSQLSGEITFSYPEKKVMLLGGAPVYSEGGVAGLVMAFHDITAIRHLEKVRRDFIANVSHELRTPVTSVKGYAETLLDGALEDRETALEFVRIIDREAGRLSRLITELLDISRMENRKEPFQMERVDLAGIMKDVSKNMQQKADREGIRLHLELDTEPLWVAADTDKIQQVLNNLLENALKYSPPRGDVRLLARREGKEVTVSVSDNGPGIPPSELSRVFERFYRVEKDRSRKQGGSGLGLAIVKHIVEGHGGRVWAENNPRRGARFLFTLPLTP